MIEGIKEIGKIRLSGKEEEFGILDSLLENLPQKQNRELQIVILNYNIFERKINIEFENIKEDTAQKYLWMGKLPSNNPQIYSTTSNLDYLISQVIPNLTKKAPEGSTFSRMLNQVIDTMFCDIGLKGRRKFVLNLEKCRIVEQGYMEELKKKVDKRRRENIKESAIFKEVMKDIRAKMDNFISQESKVSLKKGDIGLYTLKINNKLMAENEEYQRLVIKEKIDSLFGDKEKVCSSCGENKPITDRPKFARARSALGYYITDKVGFSSKLSGDFTKSFTLCKDCYRDLLSGEVFVRNRLSSNIGGLNLYIIPKFLFSAGISQNQLDKWADYIKDSFNSVKSLAGLKEFEERLERYKEFENIKNNFFLNFLFFKARQAEFKVLKLIKDVPPTRLEILTRVANEVKDTGENLLGEPNKWEISLRGIYYLIPMRKRIADITEYRKILEIYDAIFSENPISYRFLIQQFIELAQVYRFEKFDVYNIGRQNPDIGLIYASLKANLLLLYLKKLGILKGGKGNMDYDSLDLDEGIKSFVNEMGYNEPKVAMFLLGYLIGEVGNAQYREGNSKPVLGKITYQGMNKNKLIRLLNEVFEKIVQYNKKYKTLHYNEGIFAECKRLMDKTIDKPLSDQENVFYVLSGYAYATHQAIKASK